jgi:hypothetical protein
MDVKIYPLYDKEGISYIAITAKQEKVHIRRKKYVVLNTFAGLVYQGQYTESGGKTGEAIYKFGDYGSLFPEYCERFKSIQELVDALKSGYGDSYKIVPNVIKG